jgi:hypothetical protein
MTSTIVDVIGSVTEGQADQAIEAAASFVRTLRERRSQKNANPLSDPRTPAAENESEPERRRPLRDVLRRALKRD